MAKTTQEMLNTMEETLSILRAYGLQAQVYTQLGNSGWDKTTEVYITAVKAMTDAINEFKKNEVLK